MKKISRTPPLTKDHAWSDGVGYAVGEGPGSRSIGRLYGGRHAQQADRADYLVGGAGTAPGRGRRCRTRRLGERSCPCEDAPRPGREAGGAAAPGGRRGARPVAGGGSVAAPGRIRQAGWGGGRGGGTGGRAPGQA